MPPATTRKLPAPITWPKTTELIGVRLRLKPLQDALLYPQYPIGLHDWFLEQVHQTNPHLSAQLHDGDSPKPVTLSALQGLAISSGRSLPVSADQTYDWLITALAHPVTEWMQGWLKQPPLYVDLRDVRLQIQDWAIVFPATTYSRIWQTDIPAAPVQLSFISPTSFRHQGYHFPLPLPVNVFHSYLRRWNEFADVEYDLDDFWDWIDESVIISHHQLRSHKVLAGKKGSVTGFTGAIEYQLTSVAQQEPEYVQLFYRLAHLAPYFGTGHKTTFGLGQTRLGWLEDRDIPPSPAIPTVLAQRIAELTEIFKAQKKRQGGDRATRSAETWATILARRELGESLPDITADLEMPYETVKTYAKLAKRALQLANENGTPP